MQHEKEVSVPGWSGTGYMVIDNTNGDGAFLIGGGGNGGWAKIKEYLGYVLDIAKMFAKTVFKRITDLYDRVINFIDLINECQKNIWQALAMLYLVTFLFTMITLGLVLSLSPIGRIASIGITMIIGTILAQLSKYLGKKCQ